jgi:hypothetical protein
MALLPKQLAQASQLLLLLVGPDVGKGGGVHLDEVYLIGFGFLYCKGLLCPTYIGFLQSAI